MFTVVIPTMWRPNTFEEQLNSLCCSEYVDEIILINNDKNITPSFNILNHKKILHINSPENLVVNPSWNLGVMLSKNNNICLLNDDILFDIDVFKFMSSHKDKHLCGLSMNNQDGNFKLVEAEKRITGFGCMMFIKKDSYDFIPNDLIMFFGDDYLFHLNNKKGNKNYNIYGCKNNGVWGITSKPGVQVNDAKADIINNEGTAIKRALNEKGIVFYTE
jgi:hypothetical protein